MLPLQVTWIIFDGENDVEDSSGVNHNSPTDTDMQDAGPAPCIG